MSDTPATAQAARIWVDADACPGVQTGGPAVFHARDHQVFASQLDRWLAGKTEHPAR